jgi:hypothetical protein
MGLGHSPIVVSEGLVFYFDPINTRSYAGTGLTGYNLINTAIVGTFTNGPAYDSANKGSINFDGVDDYIDFGSSTTFKLIDNFTLSAWVKSTVYGDRAILGNFGPSTDYSGFNLNIQPSNKFAFLTGSAASATYLYSNDTFLLNKWYHLTAVRSNGTNYLYVNGVGQSSTNTQVVKYSNQNFYFGKWYSNLTGFYHNGHIASAALYNRALSSTEILQNYNATKKRFSPEENIVTNGLVLNIDAGNNLRYPGTGITALNIAGVGATGVLINGVGFGVSSGGSFIFDGTNDYIDCGKDSITNFVTTTMSAEIMFQTTGATNRPHLIGRGTNGSAGQFVLILESFVPLPRMRFYLDKGSGWTAAATGNTTIQNNQWYHVVGVYDGINAYVYVNGTLDVSAASTGTLSSTPSDSVTVGFFTGSAAHYLTGKIPFARLYNRALSSTEILQNYNALKGRYGLS